MVTNRLKEILFSSVSIAPLVVFRLIFGLLILFGTIRFVSYGWVNDLYIQPDFFFPYLGFAWVKPLPGAWMYIPFILLMVTAVLVTIGYYYRIASFLLFVSFTYIELLDKTNYLNHYYFISLMAFIMCWLPANRLFSVDVRMKRVAPTLEVAAFNIFLLQFQLGVVYFFAGIAKLNVDWLFKAEPLLSWLNGFDNLPIIGNLLAQPWIAFVFAWIACIYDLSIVFLLIYRKTRLYAYFFVLVFHLITWLLFPIGVFPWVMILSTLVFFSADFHQNLLLFIKKILRIKDYKPIFQPIIYKKKWVQFLLGTYVFFQLAIPLRCWLYPGNLFWTEEGFRFSWRVMLMQKTGYANFYLVDKTTKRSMEINNRDFLTVRQESQMSTQPDMILQFSKHLYTIFKDTILQFGNQSFHLKDPAIYATIDVSLNGRHNQAFVRPGVDLAQLPYNLDHRTWLEKQNDE
jgi:hypothetical protein